MKWTFGIENKVKISVALLLLVGAVMFNNYRLSRLSNRVADSVQTIYEDRLVVQDLIYSYSQLLAHLDENTSSRVGSSDRKEIIIAVKALNTQYLNTLLTEEEAQLFDSFSHKLHAIVLGEQSPTAISLNSLEQDLNRLSEIQMEEAKVQMDLIKQINGSQKAGFYFESVTLIILLLIIQVLLLSSTSIQKALRKESPHQLN